MPRTLHAAKFPTFVPSAEKVRSPARACARWAPDFRARPFGPRNAQQAQADGDQPGDHTESKQPFGEAEPDFLLSPSGQGQDGDAGSGPRSRDAPQCVLGPAARPGTGNQQHPGDEEDKAGLDDEVMQVSGHAQDGSSVSTNEHANMATPQSPIDMQAVAWDQPCPDFGEGSNHSARARAIEASPTARNTPAWR